MPDGRKFNGPGGGRLARRNDLMADRRAEVARLRLQGKTHEQIARDTGWSHQTVRNDLEWLGSQWRREASLDYDQLMSQELQQLSAIRCEAWRRLALSSTRMNPEGDARFLAVALQTSSKIVELLGLDDPVKFQGRKVQGEAGSETSVDIVEVVVDDREQLEEITDEHGVIRLSAFQEKLERDASKKEPDAG